jgi:hypothetical protein
MPLTTSEQIDQIWFQEGFEYYATSGSAVIGEKVRGEVAKDKLITQLIHSGLKQDIVIWIIGPPDSLAYTLIYAPRGYRVKEYAYVNWPLIESLPEDQLW